MKKGLGILLTALLLLSTSITVSAHPGKLDKNGGHNCSESSKAKGLCTGYHYHNGGGSTSAPVVTPAPKPAPAPVQAPTKPKLVTATVYINGVKQYFNQDAYIKNGTTLVPMRPIFEALGATVEYDSSTKKVTGTKNGKVITLTVGNSIAYIKTNGFSNSVGLSHPAEIMNGSTMVPLRFVSEALGATVEYDSATRVIKISQ